MLVRSSSVSPAASVESALCKASASGVAGAWVMAAAAGGSLAGVAGAWVMAAAVATAAAAGDSLAGFAGTASGVGDAVLCWAAGCSSARKSPDVANTTVNAPAAKTSLRIIFSSPLDGAVTSKEMHINP